MREIPDPTLNVYGQGVPHDDVVMALTPNDLRKLIARLSVVLARHEGTDVHEIPVQTTDGVPYLLKLILADEESLRILKEPYTEVPTYGAPPEHFLKYREYKKDVERLPKEPGAA